MLANKRTKSYVCIDLKSFYASVECVDRGLDPFTENLVVADPDRGSGTICLAITPAMKALGVKNRCRIFQIPNGIEYTMATPRMARYMDVSAQINALYLRYVSTEDIHVYRHRRMLHRCNSLPEAVPHGRKGLRRNAAQQGD